jgi:hypothetical protein
MGRNIAQTERSLENTQIYPAAIAAILGLSPSIKADDWIAISCDD